MEKKKMTKEEVVDALKKAVAHKEEAYERSLEIWKEQGVKGKATLL